MSEIEIGNLTNIPMSLAVWSVCMFSSMWTEIWVQGGMPALCFCCRHWSWICECTQCYEWRGPLDCSQLDHTSAASLVQLKIPCLFPEKWNHPNSDWLQIYWALESFDTQSCLCSQCVTLIKNQEQQNLVSLTETIHGHINRLLSLSAWLLITRLKLQNAWVTSGYL